MLPHFYKDIFCLLLFFSLVFLTISCGKVERDRVPVEFEVCNQEELPDELYELIEERKEEPFQFTYENSAYLYLAIGYGRQRNGECVAAVREVYEEEGAVVVDTILVNVSKKEEMETGEPDFCPYIVLRCEKEGDVVLFYSAME